MLCCAFYNVQKPIKIIFIRLRLISLGENATLHIFWPVSKEKKTPYKSILIVTYHHPRQWTHFQSSHLVSALRCVQLELLAVLESHSLSFRIQELEGSLQEDLQHLKRTLKGYTKV